MKSGSPGTPTRTYRMRARAAAKAETRERILQAAMAVAVEDLDLDPTLAVVAARAGVSVQTLLRHFQSRDGLLDSVIKFAGGLVQEEREAPAGDIAAALRILVDHYELRGEFVLHMLAQEPGNARVHSMAEPGRRLHREWVGQVFAPWLHGSSDQEREALTDLLVVVTDVYAWKLLRRDRGLTREETQARLVALAHAVTDSASSAR